ncbi:MAG: hypothetical protein ACRYFU_19765 [Janthinobacterium lividum]
MHASLQVNVKPARDAGAHRLAQAVLLIMLYSLPALVGLHTAAVSDPDIWWHLRSGEWIVQHHSFPHLDLFSIFGAGKPWQAYSWLFETLVFELFHHFGVLGIVAYTAGALLAITVACHHLLRRLQYDFSAGVLLTLAACFSCGHLYTPRPWLLSILFFVLEMDILMQVRRTGDRRELVWLPVIFLLWANVHIQFVDGLLILGLAWAESALSRWHRGVSTHFDLRFATLVSLASFGATLCNPYGWHIYRVAFDLAAQPGVLNKVQELQAVPFRDPADWCLLALSMGAVAVLARSGRLFSFEAALLPIAMFFSFRSQRDVWILAVTSVVILASYQSSIRRSATGIPATRVPAWMTPAIVAMSTLVVFSYAHMRQFDHDHLNTRLAETLPVRALAFVNASQYRGPVYNDYAWGGYLIWSLRQPVSIDGRAAFYGDQRIDRSMATWNGRPDWNMDPDLNSAHLIIGPVQAPLTQLLRTDSGVKLVYQDQLAAVFVRATR